MGRSATCITCLYLILMTSASDPACDASSDSCTDDIRLLQRKVEVASNDIAEKSFGQRPSDLGTTGGEKNTPIEVKDGNEGRVAYPDGADENQDEDEVVDAHVDLQEQVAVEQEHESVEHEIGAMESDDNAITDEAAPYKLTRANLECKSKDVWIGRKSSAQDCANAVLAAGGTFFIFGKGAKAGWCYKESTSSASCPEGWENDYYDFFTIQHPPCRKSSQSTVGAYRESRRRDSRRRSYGIRVEEKQGNCHFPFRYKGVCYSTCATAGEYRPWCYTDASFTTWGFCASYDTMFTGDCKTDKAFNLPSDFNQRRRAWYRGRRRMTYQKETSCVFPFKYDGTTYHECTMQGHTKKWCYFQVDVHGVGVPGRWGHCKMASSRQCR